MIYISSHAGICPDADFIDWPVVSTLVHTTQLPAQTKTQTRIITHTTQLPAHTSYATTTEGTQTIVSTLSEATKTVHAPPVTHTVVRTTELPAPTNIGEMKTAQSHGAVLQANIIFQK